MSRRKTVKLNLEFVNPRIKEVCHNNVIFCNQMGRPNQKTWVTDWNRVKDGNWAPKNLPSPEEAARMCILLKSTPEEILLHEGKTEKETAKCLEDIQRVKELVAELRKEEAVPTTTGSPITREAWEAEAEKWSDEDLIKAMRKLLAIQEERRETNGD